MKTYFDGIKEVLIQEIKNSEFIIYAAVAWITDYDLISTLIERLKSGVQVELIVNGDNQFSKVKSKFNQFLSHGGKLFLYENNNQSIMHNKFCVIDLNTTITGSFNWSIAASERHKENIIIEKGDFFLASQFAREFFRIKKCSIVFDSKYILYDSAIHATVKTTGSFSEEGFEQYCWAEIEDNNRSGVLFIYNCEPHIIPDKIFGVWTERAIDTTENSHVPAVHNGKPFYSFDCLDSRLAGYRVE
ncbi:phospholipase D-like domain-containing protein [Hymenobacter sp. BT175]|uniref:phospholipase D-like domain-containing protein n=1 Tax=Hymenobacter translucens TaxID=2886507 RepID=UPI001D0F10C0|nr:phospholipase D-like domain-containing protein [Hymenobacter translucens]MCC2544959.1 phospholipase D-like domain-containing protein [Hymenobacter translucens]